MISVSSPVVAVFNGVHQISHVLMSLQKAGVSGMLVVGSQRLNEHN